MKRRLTAGVGLVAGAQHVPQFLWHNGEIVPWKTATVQIHDFAYGAPSAVFDGMRAYVGDEGLAVFRLDDHVDRFVNSMRIFDLLDHISPHRIGEGVLELILANKFVEDCYVVPFAFWTRSDVNRAFAVPELDARTDVWVMGWGVPSALDTNAPGMRVCTSSWTRVPDNVLPTSVKAVAIYQTFRLAMRDAHRAGYESCILMNSQGYVSEAPGACVIVRTRDRWITPSLASDVLDSITRRTVIELIKDQFNQSIEIRPVMKSELYEAEECLLVGTGVEITPVFEVDGIPVGRGIQGDATEELRSLYRDIVRGRVPRYRRWLTPVDARI